MSARVLGLRALPITFLIFVLEALFAAFASWPNGVELTSRVSALSLDPGALRELAVIAKGFARGHALSALALFVLAPWLQMSWLIMLSEPQSPLRALARGVRSVPRAWLISLVLAVFFVLLALPLLATVYGVHRAFDGPDVRRHDLATAASFLPLLGLAFYFHVAFDLARAASLELRTFRSVWRGLRKAFRPSAFFAALGASLVGLFLPVAAHVSSWQLGALTATMLLQTVLFLRLIVRAAWLGHALALVRPPVEIVNE